jgi:membrane-associated phospholipid phosphatase
VAVAALLVGSLLAALVWHAVRLDAFDAWVMQWQDRAYAHGDEAAELVAGVVPVGFALLTMVAGAVLACLAGRRDAVVLAVVAAPATILAESVLKDLVHRQWNSDPSLLFPSGHVAVTTAAAMTAVLVARVLPVSRDVRVATACVGAACVLVVGVARLVETVHSLTDVVGGAATGLVVTLGAALAITAWARPDRQRPSLVAPSRSETP